MSEKTVEQRCRECLEPNLLFPGELTPESTYDSLHMDSLDGIEFVMALEEEFCYEIPDQDADLTKWRTFQDVVDYITRLVEAKQAS